MELVIGTHSFLVAVMLNQEWKISEFNLLANGHHYGIALPNLDGSKFIAKSDAENCQKLTTYKKDKSNSSWGYSPSNELELGKDFRTVHQISSFNGGIYIANTDFNSLDYISESMTQRDQFFFNDVDYDLNHINSVFPCGQKEVLVMLHNRGKKESEFVLLNHTPSKGFKIINKRYLWDQGCHNIFIGNDQLVYNSSHSGHLVIVDLYKSKIRNRIKFPGHTKGLSVTQKYFIIGFSEHEQRDARFNSNGYLAIIDRDKLGVIATVDLNHPSLPHPIGNVNEIRCLSETDYGHAGVTAITENWHRKSFAYGDLRYQFLKFKEKIDNKIGRFLQRNQN